MKEMRNSFVGGNAQARDAKLRRPAELRERLRQIWEETLVEIRKIDEESDDAND